MRNEKNGYASYMLRIWHPLLDAQKYPLHMPEPAAAIDAVEAAAVEEQPAGVQDNQPAGWSKSSLRTAVAGADRIS